jgi:hypothetical protein
MRRNAKVDANHGVIVAALRQVGASVQDLAKVGQGCPDILVGYRGQNFLMEIKTTKGKATLPQIAWHEFWQGQVVVVRDVDEALHVIGALR